MSYAPPPEVLARLTPAEVEAAVRAIYVTRAGSTLRPEEVKKIPEVAGMLPVLARTRRDPLLADAAAGGAPVGLVAAHLLGWSRVVLIERGARPSLICPRGGREAPGRRCRGPRGGRVRPGGVAGVTRGRGGAHACGRASNVVIDQAMRRRVPWLLVAPCCYADAVPFSATARAWADQLGVPSQAAVRRPFVESLIDSERTLRLEAGGYRVSVEAFVAPTVTPHNRVWKAQWKGPGRRTSQARERLADLAAGPSPASSR